MPKLPKIEEATCSGYFDISCMFVSTNTGLAMTGDIECVGSFVFFALVMDFTLDLYGLKLTFNINKHNSPYIIIR